LQLALIWIDTRSEFDNVIAREISLNAADFSTITAINHGIDVHLADNVQTASQIAQTYDHALIFPLGTVLQKGTNFIVKWYNLNDKSNWHSQLSDLIFTIPTVGGIEQVNELYLKNIRDRCSYYTCNTEPVYELENDTIKHLIMPCSGLHPWLYISQVKNNPQLTFFDSSPFSCVFYRYMLDNWDGVDYPAFVRDYSRNSQDFQMTFYRKIDELDSYWHTVQQYVQKHSGKSFEEVWRENRDAIVFTGDILSPTFLDRLAIDNHPTTVLSLSNILHYAPATFLNSVDTMRSQEIRLNKYIQDNYPSIKVLSTGAFLNSSNVTNFNPPWRQQHEK